MTHDAEKRGRTDWRRLGLACALALGMAAPVWALLERLTARIGPRPTLLERDGHLPPFAELVAERGRAQSVLAATPRLALEVTA